MKLNDLQKNLESCSSRPREKKKYRNVWSIDVKYEEMRPNNNFFHTTLQGRFCYFSILVASHDSYMAYMSVMW